jgi:hypothetical protein
MNLKNIKHYLKILAGDFRHYAEKHRPHVAARIIGYEIVDNPTDPDLLALARKEVLKHDRLRGISNPL